MSRTAFFTVSTIACVIAMPNLLRGEEDPEEQERVAPTQRIERALHLNTNLQILEGSALSDAIELISRQFDIPILPAWERLAEEGVERDMSVALDVSGVELQSALTLLLDPLGLTWHIDDEVLKITTQQAAERILEVHVYDVRPLDDAGIDSKLLADTLRQIVRPHTWTRVVQPNLSPDDHERAKAKQDGVATVVPLPGLLVVAQSQRVHAEIVELLEQIETRLSGQATDEAIEER